MSFDLIRQQGIDIEVAGKTVLDIGGYHGDFALALLNQGAESATVVDSGEWKQYGWDEPRRYEGVAYHTADLLDWHEPADVVVCYNVIYHVKDVYRAMEHLRELTNERLCLCTSFVPGDEPSWRLFHPNEGRWPEQATRYTVFWKPTLAGLERLLELTGFQIEARFGPVGDHVVYRCA